jgi:membrane protein DedA with SNARE-associated domain
MPIPAFYTQLTLSSVNPGNALWLATYGYIGCLLGTPIGYGIGRLLGKGILEKLLKKTWVDKATAMFQKHGDTAVLVGAFTPIPFKIFTILSGAMKFPLWRLMCLAAIGRAAKFYIVGGLFYVFGKAADSMMGNVIWYALIAMVPIVGIYFLVRRTLAKRRAVKQAVAHDGAVAKFTVEGAADGDNQLVLAETAVTDDAIALTETQRETKRSADHEPTKAMVE